FVLAIKLREKNIEAVSSRDNYFMRISNIRISNLYGVFNHEIHMRLEDRTTIIHGPNGFGKTAILRLINALFSSKPFEISAIPFQELVFRFDDGAELTIKRTEIPSNSPVPGTRP